MQLLRGQLPEHVQRVAVHDGLLVGQLSVHVPSFGRLHARLLERPLPDLLRRRNVHGRLLQWPLQHLVSFWSDVHRRLLRWGLRARLRAGGELLVHELSFGIVLVHGFRMSLTGAFQRRLRWRPASPCDERVTSKVGIRGQWQVA